MKKKYIILSIILIMIVISFIIFQTYAKYITSITGDTETGIARWNIKINNTNIINGTELNNTITPTFPGTTNIAPNVIAPTAEGYFDITLDATNTDVSLRYTITTSDNEDSAVSDLIVSGYSIDGGQRQSVVLTEQNPTFQIQDTIAYNSNDKDVSIRIYIKWNDDANNGATMDNSDDTDATSDSTNKAKINVNFRVIQIPNS